MKTKIFVCSNSGIDYISHDNNISAIPVIIHFTDEEEYEDYIDVSYEAFYNRMRYSNPSLLETKFQTYNKINEYIAKAKEDGYEQILFLLSSNEFSNLYIPVTISKHENEDIPIYIYESNTCAYPLAYMALTANNFFLNGKSIDDVYYALDLIKKNHRLLFFIPEYTNEYSSKFYKKYKNGVIFNIENGKIVAIDNTKKISDIDFLYAIFKEEVEGMDANVFFQFTDKNTKYLPLMHEMLDDLDMGFKKVKSYPLAPAVGYKFGLNTLCIGYVLNVDFMKEEN